MTITLERPYGLLAQFESAHALIAAARKVREAGYDKIDAFTPYPIHELLETVSPKRSKVPLITLIGGTVGALTGFFLQYWSQVFVYPMNIGGRPHNSWPSFIVVTFELTILFAALSAVIGMIALNKLPMPYHPVFNAPNFRSASRDGFFLVVEADDEHYDRRETEVFLRGLGAKVVEVES
jgi:hypothetical protein